jgi:hypothetical protein
MWRGHEKALLEYVFSCVREADKRGIKTDKNVSNLKELTIEKIDRWGDGLPNWYHDFAISHRVMATHKANLYRKDPIFYFDFASAVSDEDNKPCCERCNYFWVTHVVAG